MCCSVLQAVVKLSHTFHLDCTTLAGKKCFLLIVGRVNEGRNTGASAISLISRLSVEFMSAVQCFGPCFPMQGVIPAGGDVVAASNFLMFLSRQFIAY